MKLHQKLNLALERCGFPLLKRTNAYRKIGAGAWHDAYMVYPRGGDRLVIRLRKTIIYGRSEQFDECYLHEDYAPVGLYYGQANRCRPGICPVVYTYSLDPELTFTIESYMGRAMALVELTLDQARTCGHRLGQFFRAMHDLPPPIAGFGDPVWTGRGLAGRDWRARRDIWQDEIKTLREQFDRLSRAELRFDRTCVARTLDQALIERRFDQEPITLVNGDITPENLITRRGAFAALVDPVPRLHNGLRYAAFFIYCYRAYLANLADAPRYARHQFQRYRPIMRALADGYLEAYAQGDETIERNLWLETFLWSLRVSHETLARLEAEPNEEIRLRAGDKKTITARLERCLRELEGCAA